MAVLQSSTRQTFAPASSKAIAFSTACTPGSLIVVAVTMERFGGAYTASVADGQAGSYTADATGAIAANETGGGYSIIFSKQNSSSSTLTVTATFTGSDYGSMQIFELSGRATSSPVDVFASGGSLGGGQTLNLGLTTLSAGCDVIACATNYPGTATADSGFTLATGPIGNSFHSTEYKANVGAAGAVTINLGLTAATLNAWSGAAVAYKVAGGGGGSTLRTKMMAHLLRGRN